MRISAGARPARATRRSYPALFSSRSLFVLAAAFFVWHRGPCGFETARAAPAYLDANAPVEERVKDLVSRLSLSEKVMQLGNTAPKIVDPARELDVPAYQYWNEALHGVARSGVATVFPQAIALGSTWNPDLLLKVASVISDEARVYNNTTGKGLTYWSPTINLSRDPRWGRVEESYTEDPYLMSRMAVAFVQGMQGNDPRYLKTVATVKHFIANNSEFNRHFGSSNVDQRDLREYYFPPFRAAVEEGQVFSVMSAYNAVNGIPCSAHTELLQDLLRKEAGFQGYVVSDCDAIEDIFATHRHVADGERASAAAIKAGTDLNCGFGSKGTYQSNLEGAVQKGLVTEDDIDTALSRVLKARFLLGDFDPPELVPYKSLPQSALDSQENRALALDAARQSIVLLRNESQALPIDKSKIRSIAIIGPNAARTVVGGYSGTPPIRIHPLKGVRDNIGNTALNAFSRLDAVGHDEASGVRIEYCAEGGDNLGWIDNGDWLEYRSVDFGTGAAKLVARVASLGQGGTIEARLDAIDGTLVGACTVPPTGGWQTWTSVECPLSGAAGIHDLFFVFRGATGFLFNVSWFEISPADPSYAPAPAPGHVLISYARGCGIKSQDKSRFPAAVAAAKASDVAIVVVGTDQTIADEGRDRASLALYGVQEELIEEVHAANSSTIVVLVTGAPLAINWASENVAGIVNAWYGGQSQGAAIADVLFGDYNPGGKLPITWFRSTEDLPPISDYAIRQGRTYMYFSGEPLYPFGYGLSYTEFEYSAFALDRSAITPEGSVTVSFKVENKGTRAGEEVVQLYARAPRSAEERPLLKLVDFRRVSIARGASETVSFSLAASKLAFWSTTASAFIVDPGTYELLVGSSSADIRLSGELIVDPDADDQRSDGGSGDGGAADSGGGSTVGGCGGCGIQQQTGVFWSTLGSVALLLALALSRRRARQRSGGSAGRGALASRRQLRRRCDDCAQLEGGQAGSGGMREGRFDLPDPSGE